MPLRSLGFAAILFGFLAAPAAAESADCAPLTRVETPALPSVAQAIDQGALAIAVFGSSSTSGLTVGADAAYPAAAKAVLARRLAGSVALELEAHGVPGESGVGALARFTDFLDQRPIDLLVWQVGTNDAVAQLDLDGFDTVLNAGAERARARGVDLVLVDPQFFPRALGNPLYPEFVARIAAAGLRHGLPVIRRYARMRAAWKADPDSFDAWMAKDRFHMSPLAHACLGADLAEAILGGAEAAR